MDDTTPEQIFNKMMEKQMEQQQTALNKGAPQTPGGTQQGPSMEEQRILNQVRSQAPAPPAVPTQGQCPQCQLFHPPVGPGERCPNAPLEVEGTKTINVNEIVVKVKDILASQLEQNEVKDIDKFVGGMIVALMKYCEEYKE